jgi:hypothetical protein
MPTKNSKIKHNGRHNIALLQLYKKYIALNKSSNIDRKTFVNVICLSNEKIANYIIKDVNGFKLPEHLGLIIGSKVKKKTLYKNMDFTNSLKYGKDIYYINMHSFGDIYKMKYFNRHEGNRFKNASLYSYTPCRVLSRSFASGCKNGNQYPEWLADNFINKDKLFKKIDNLNQRNIWR